jgi:hypothetical protein
MLCPNCKTHSVRKVEIEDKEALQCHLCNRVFEMDESNHLRPVCAQPAENKPAVPQPVETKAPITETNGPLKEISQKRSRRISLATSS